MSKTFVKVYMDYETTKILYAGQNREIAEKINIQQIEGDEYCNFGGASNKLEIWEDGKKIEEIVEFISHPDDEELDDDSV